MLLNESEKERERGAKENFENLQSSLKESWVVSVVQYGASWDHLNMFANFPKV